MLPTDLQGAIAPDLEAMDGQAPEIDPGAVVDAAVANGTAAVEHEQVVTPAEKAALVQYWWDRTAETAEFRTAVEQAARDLQDLNGGKPDEVKDDAEITVQHIYRNGVQTVALTVPEMASIRWKPRTEVNPLPGMPKPAALVQRRRQQQGMAEVMSVLWLRFSEMGNFQEKIEAYVQDSVHFPAAVLKVWFQRDLRGDYLGETRLPDEQDLIARARVLIEMYDRGEFDRHDARYAQMQQCLKAIGKTEADVKRGIVLELRPLECYRCDPAVTGPEYLDTAGWESDDVMMTRADILAKWEHISPDDLFDGQVYQLDETGRAVRDERMDRTKNTGTTQIRDNDRSNLQPKDEDWMLCREIFDYENNTRLVLIEGLGYPAVEEPLERGPLGMSPFVVLVENRKPKSLYGYSDTQLQSKSQRQLNKTRSQEEDSRRRAQARWGYDPATVTNPEDLQKAVDADPGSLTPIRTNAKPGEFEKAFINLAGNNAHNGQDYRVAAEVLTQEMRKMAMLPEQASGELGAANFSSEVQVAAAGANALARYRQARIKRALTRIADKIAQLILLNVPQELAVRLCGPMAAMFYPATPMERREIYDGLTITVEVQLDKQLDYAKRADAVAKLIDSLARAGVVFDKETAGKLLGKLMGVDEAEDLIQPDPNDLIGRLMMALQDDPSSLAPEAVQALAQMGAMAQQMAAQMAAQAMAEQATTTPTGSAAP